jgi:hypothetical protein
VDYKAGNFSTHRKCEIIFTLPALHKHTQITWNCYVDESNAKSISYNLIIGRDLMHEIGIDICFSAAEVRWDNASIPMQPVDKSIEEFEQELLFAQDPLTTDAERIQNSSMMAISKSLFNLSPLNFCSAVRHGLNSSAATSNTIMMISSAGKCLECAMLISSFLDEIQDHASNKNQRLWSQSSNETTIKS